MKFKIGDIVKHIISNKKYVIIKCKKTFFKKKHYYICGTGKEIYGEEMQNIYIDEPELVIAKKDVKVVEGEK